MKYFKEILATCITVLWSIMVIANLHDPLIIGAMIGLMTGSVAGYYFGTSKTGVETATKNADAVTAMLANDPTKVEVVNDADAPVPTVEAK